MSRYTQTEKDVVLLLAQLRLTLAEQWLRDPAIISQAFPANTTNATSTKKASAPGQVHIYTDGGCRGNPGPGGYGAIIDDGEKQTELSRGYRLTTNNRMELMACIAALEVLEKPTDVVLHSDSSYVVNGISKGWARKWRSQNWMRTKTEAAENADLWSRLLELCERHRVTFVWVKGHAGHPGNERCDQLATSCPTLSSTTASAARWTCAAARWLTAASASACKIPAKGWHPTR